MHTKNIILAMLCLCLLSGCSDKENDAISSSDIIETTTAENTYAEKTTAILTDKPQTTMTEPETRSMVNDTDLETKQHEPDEYEFRLNGNEISVYFDNYELGTVPTNNESNNEADIEFEDYNFDGYYDIFVCDSLITSKLGKTGDYWLWDHHEREFKKSKELAVAYGKGLDFNIGDNKLYAEYTEDHIDRLSSKYCTAEFEWNGDKLVPVSIKKYYGQNFVGQGTFDINNYDTYKPDKDGNWKMTEHSIKNAYEMDPHFTDNNPIYLRISENSVDNMRGDSVIQQIPLKNAAKLNDKIAGFTAKTGDSPIFFDNITSYMDYDSDGYNDLCLAIDVNDFGEIVRYRYYHYEPSTGMYNEWTEMNDVTEGYQTITDQGDILCYKNSTEDNITYENTYYYNWDNGKLKAVKRYYRCVVEYEDGDTYKSDARYYKYDENGNEYEYDPGGPFAY